jgi:hypothetical protein
MEADDDAIRRILYSPHMPDRIKRDPGNCVTEIRLHATDDPEVFRVAWLRAAHAWNERHADDKESAGAA